MGKVRSSSDSGGVPATKTKFIYAEDATRMNSSGTSFLSDGDEFVSFSGTGSSDTEAGFPIMIPDDFKSVIEIIINHTSAITGDTVNYKLGINVNNGNYDVLGEILTYPAVAGAPVSWDRLTDVQVPSSTVFAPGQGYSFRVHRDATLDTYTGLSYIRCIGFKYSTV